MSKFLWDFSFDSLFFEEGGEEVIAEATTEELMIIKKLRQHFERTLEKCHKQIETIGGKEFLNRLPEFMHYDMVLQLCLLHSLSVAERIPGDMDWISIIENEAEIYFYEYRCFGRRFDFEKYSIINQITTV